MTGRPGRSTLQCYSVSMCGTWDEAVFGNCYLVLCFSHTTSTDVSTVLCISLYVCACLPVCPLKQYCSCLRVCVDDCRRC